MSTYASLLTPPTLAAIKADLFAYLEAQNFPVTNWRSGGKERTIVESQAQIVFDFASDLASEVVLWVLLDTAEGDALTALASSNYSIEREPASFEMRYFRLFDDASEGPFSIAVNQLIFSTDDGLLFTNTTGGTIALDGELFVFLRAQEAGGDYAGVVITQLKTPIPGMDWEEVVFLSEEILAQLTQGADEEDDARLRTRAKAQWALLGMGSVREAYERRALDASTSVTRALARENTPTAGDVKVFIAGEEGTVGSGVVDDVQAYLEDDARRPLCTTVDVEAATEVPVSVTATIKVKAAFGSSYLGLATAALETLINDRRISEGDSNLDVLSLDEITEALMSPPGALDVTSLTVPSGNIALDLGEIATVGTITLTKVEV